MFLLANFLFELSSASKVEIRRGIRCEHSIGISNAELEKCIEGRVLLGVHDFKEQLQMESFILLLNCNV